MEVIQRKIGVYRFLQEELKLKRDAEYGKPVNTREDEEQVQRSIDYFQGKIDALDFVIEDLEAACPPAAVGAVKDIEF